METGARGPGEGRVGTDADIQRWRQRALDHVMWALLAIGVAPALLVGRAVPEPLAPVYRAVALLAYATVLALALARRLDHALRAWTFLVVGFVIAAMMLAGRGLEGAGRLVLVVLPIYATVLVGSRAGWATGVASVALFAVAGALEAAGVLHRLPAAHDGTRAPGFWAIQGTMLVLVVLPALLLVAGFIDLLQRTLAAERAAAARVAEADRERRLLERALLETGERERRAVGHQLHDGPCQQLTGALLRCHVAQNVLDTRGTPGEAKAHLESIAGLLDASIGEIHDLARGLSPAELSPAACAAALGGLAAQVRATTSIACEVAHDGVARPATAEVSSQLFRIAQEAVANAVRHAGATRIRIELGGDGHGLRLVVEDDGAGIASAAPSDGMGLRIMRYRAELIGGVLSVGPAPGGGTSVSCLLPRAAESQVREALP